LRRRVEADPASIAFAALAEEYRRVGRCDEAVETCLAGLQRHPAYLSARVTLGRALIETGNLDSAREQFETVLRAAPENIAATRGLAQIHERLGHTAEMDPHLAQIMREHAESVARPEPPSLAIAPAPIAAPEPEPEPAALVDLEPPAPAGAAAPLDLQPLDLDWLERDPIEPEPIGAGAEALQPLSLDPSAPELPTSQLGDPQPEALEPPAPELPIPPRRNFQPVAVAPSDPQEPAARFTDLPAAPMAALSPIERSAPDPAVVAAIAGLERFLSAIQHARHA
jgi:hypothetical protein